MLVSATRVEQNELRFASANNQIASIAGLLPPRELVPFLCECPDARCSEIAELSLGEYAALRLFANRYVLSRRCRAGDYAHTLLVETTERFRIVDRLGA